MIIFTFTYAFICLRTDMLVGLILVLSPLVFRESALPEHGLPSVSWDHMIEHPLALSVPGLSCLTVKAYGTSPWGVKDVSHSLAGAARHSIAFFRPRVVRTEDGRMELAARGLVVAVCRMHISLTVSVSYTRDMSSCSCSWWCGW